MKNKFSILLTLFILMIKAQVGINTTTPDNSSVLDITSDNKGLLAPRLTTAEKNAIPNPATGLVVYDKDLKLYTHFDGVQWVEPSLITTVAPRTYSIIGYADTVTPTSGTTFQAITINPSGIIKDSGNGIVSTNLNSITINQSGTYLITPSGVFKKNSGAPNDPHIKAKINIIKNGSTQVSLTYFHLPVNGAGTFSASKSSTVLENLTVGDQITFQIQKEAFFDGSGATRTGTFSNMLLEVERLP
ncbi:MULTISPECIES: hypothetical protein [unclassified Chryseobacterium]|uniref:hypothetical protein n=1 Tax=unclassified Chryseobacterium TaxID=2593645 RepID=UPI00300FC01F